MRTINTTFEDDEIKFLEEKKGKVSWREFILNLAGYKRGE